MRHFVNIQSIWMELRSIVSQSHQTFRYHRSRKGVNHAPTPTKLLAVSKLYDMSDYSRDALDLDWTRRTLLQLISLRFFQFIIHPEDSQAAVEPSSIKLPKAYTSLAEKIASSLRDSIEAEAQGAPEAEVRRKADPAKESVKEFVAKWRGDSRVSWHPSHEELLGMVTELGAFYRQAGPRSKMSLQVRESILSHLDRMEASFKAPLSLDDGELVDDERLKGLF